jgi:hypothetical protein
MKEEFLYYIWENRLLNKDLQTTEGEKVDVVATGYRNTNSGPDFLEAKIQIGDKLWAGHVEIHVKSSDWNRHGHQTDKAYKNVILHVVYENDMQVNDIPTLELKGHFDESLFAQYQKLISSKNWIPCEKSIAQVPVFTRLSWFDRMAVERLESKSETVTKILNANQFDWEDALYKLLMRYFGLKVNNEAFETLANLLPFKTLLKHADNLLQVEAMLMGCAGFLEADFTEEYPLLLKREFAVMKAKFNLLTMPAERWKFMRMRPSNFPTIRLAQMAQLIHKNGCLFSKIREAKNAAEVKVLFDVKTSEYWETHWRFNPPAPLKRGTLNHIQKAKHLGETTADVLIINAVTPLLFCYGKLHKDESVCDTAMQFLEETEAEDNAIIRHFAQCGIKAENAMQTQALLHLYNMYCKRKRCLECRIGAVLLR